MNYYISPEKEYIILESESLDFLYKFRRREISATSFGNMYLILQSSVFEFPEINKKYLFEINKLGLQNLIKSLSIYSEDEEKDKQNFLEECKVKKQKRTNEEIKNSIEKLKQKYKKPL